MSKNKKALSREARAKRNFYRLVLPAFIIFALGVLLYIPFIKVHDKVVEQEMKG